MKISYPEKYNSLIIEFGEDEGIKKYKKFLRQFSLEKCILKFGEDEGKKIYDKKLNNIKNSGVSLKKFIFKYGTEEGTNRYNKWKSDVAGSRNRFIKSYGIEEGIKRYNKFKKKCAIKDYIKNDLNSKYNNRQFSTTLEYFLEKTNGDYDKAKLLLAERQNTTSLSKLIKKYGATAGLLKYNEINEKRGYSNTLDYYISKYGDIHGVIEYNKRIEKLKYANSKQKFIDEFGDKLGLEKYKEFVFKKVRNFNTSSVSKIGLKFCLEIYEKIKEEYNKIYYGDNEYMFYIHKDGIKIIKPDFYIKDINLAIEFYGDYWHRNPNSYNDEQSKKIRKKDKGRLELLKEKYNTRVIIVWEKDYLNDNYNIDNIIKKIKKHG